MSKKAKLPGMPTQDIPLKTIHKGLKHKPNKAKAIKQSGLITIEYGTVSYLGASPVISPAKTSPVPKPDDYQIRRGGVKTDSFEEGMEHLYQFPISLTQYESRFNYALLMKEEDGTYNMVDRVGMPCWGALREYDCGTRPDDSWPDDLRESIHIFPKTGNPVAVAIQFKQTGNVPDYDSKFYSTKEEWNRFQSEFVFNTAISPWRKALKDFELVIKDDTYVGVVIKDTHIDPNIMVNIFRVCGFRGSQFARRWCNMMDTNPGMDGRVAFILACKSDDYYQSAMIDLDRWFSGEPFDLSSGLTFYERESYNRPRIQYMFGDNTHGIATNEISQHTLEEYFTNWLAEEQDRISRVA